MLKLTPVLGDFRLVTEKELGPLEKGSGNSTRWIIQVEHLEFLGAARVSSAFALYRNGNRVLPGVHVFTFGAQNSDFYGARPTLVSAPDTGVFTLSAESYGPARYVLSLDILHSMYR